MSCDEWNAIEFERFDRLQRLGAIVNKKGAKEFNQEGFMHSKFMIIDNSITREGSYNFTKNAQYQDNHFDRTNNTDKRLKQFDELLEKSVDYFSEMENPTERRSNLSISEEQREVPKELLQKLAILKQQKAEEKERELVFSNSVMRKLTYDELQLLSKEIAQKQNFSALNTKVLVNVDDIRPIDDTVRTSKNGTKTFVLYKHGANLVRVSESLHDDIESGKMHSIYITGTAILASKYDADENVYILESDENGIFPTSMIYSAKAGKSHAQVQAQEEREFAKAMRAANNQLMVNAREAAGARIASDMPLNELMAFLGISITAASPMKTVNLTEEELLKQIEGSK